MVLTSQNVRNPNVYSQSFKRPKSEQNRFWTFSKARQNCSRTKIDCPKSELVRISAFHCIDKIIKIGERKILIKFN